MMACSMRRSGFAEDKPRCRFFVNDQADLLGWHQLVHFCLLTASWTL
jgi:hypothetical protein